MLVLSQANALESVMTLKGIPVRNDWKYFNPPTKDSNSRVCAAFPRWDVLKLLDRNSIGFQTVDSSAKVCSCHKLCPAANPDASHRS